MRSDILEKKDKILKWIAENQTNNYIALQLHCKVDTLKLYYKKMGIQYNGNKGGKGIKCSPFRKSALEYLKSSCVKSYILKKKLVEDGLKEDKCEICGIGPVWYGKRLPLELHHIDGNHFNNDLKNLQILCPNCHSIQE